MRKYCNYCKDEIESNDRIKKDKQGNVYHEECFEQMNTYVDEFGETSTDEFGESSSEEYGY